MKSFLGILLTFLSTFIVLFAIVFEGRFKRANSAKLSVRKIKGLLMQFPNEFGKLTAPGFFLIFLSIVLGIGNATYSCISEHDQEKQYSEDTTRYRKIIDQLEEQAKRDSSEIMRLESIIKENTARNDSIKYAIIEGAAKEIRYKIDLEEKEKQNIFFQYKAEVILNLQKAEFALESKHLTGFIGKTSFVSTKLSNVYLKKYQDISNNESIVEYLTASIEYIDKINYYLEQARTDTSSKGLNIRNINRMVPFLKDDLCKIYYFIFNISNYRHYEKLKFNDTIWRVNCDSLLDKTLFQYSK